MPSDAASDAALPHAKAPRASRRAAARGAASAPATKPLELGGLGSDELARALRAVAAELERDPALARRIADAIRTPTADAPTSGEGDTSPARISRSFRPRVVEGTSPDLGPGIPDPFALRARLGEEGLRAALDGLRIGSLRAIVREHGLDVSGAALRGNDAERLRTLILDATRLSKATRKR